MVGRASEVAAGKGAGLGADDAAGAAAAVDTLPALVALATGRGEEKEDFLGLAPVTGVVSA